MIVSVSVSEGVFKFVVLKQLDDRTIITKTKSEILPAAVLVYTNIHCTHII